MKNKLIVFITAAIMLLAASVFSFVGCGSDEKLEYSVTVLSTDGATPVEGVTVSWKAEAGGGSAKTNADGVAKANIPAGTYNVVLSGIDEGLTYEQISVTPSMSEITLVLEVKSVTYTAQVVDKNGAAAKGVTVTWSSGSTVAGTAVTGDDGSASCELDYGDYSVTVSNLPDGNVFTDAIEVTGKNQSARFELRGGETVSYTVTVKSAGGLKFKDMTVFVYSGNKPIYSGKTNSDGEIKFSQPAGDYTVSVPSVQQGYTITKQAKLTATERQGDVVLTSEVILDPPPEINANKRTYVIGDIIHDYEWTTPYEIDGKKVTYSIAELLKTKEAVVINNWGTLCSYCVQEMPVLQETYEKYKDKIELLAISNYQGGDSEATINNFRNSNASYTFPMMRDNNGFVYRFGIKGHPTTIIVDRYGAIAHIETGVVTSAELWERLFNRFVGDEYVQTFTPGEDNEPITAEVSKPDVTVPADHYEKVAAAVNKFTATDDMYVNWYGETQNEYLWPFILQTEEGVSETDEVLCSSNSQKPNSMSALYAAVKMPAGKVLTFDYYSECETGVDILSAVWDGKMIVKQISGMSGGWKTCYLYAELTGIEHRLALSYYKDNTKDVGKDNVYIRNVRFEDLSDMDEAMDMPRTAAYGTAVSGGGYSDYAQVELVDGYYHVKLNSLKNSEYAGRDNSPMLFVNMMGSTNWNGRQSISEFLYEQNEEGEYKYSCRFSINGGAVRDYRPDLIEYCRIASASDVSGFLPVDDELKAILSAFIAKVEGKEVRKDGWLELCYFYSHYGDGEFIGNPIIGLTTKTAIVAGVDETITADVTRIMAPFPSVIYAFTPTESAVYKIQSLLPLSSEQATQIWLYDDSTDVENPLAYSGDDRFFRDGQNEHNFTVYRYLTAGHKYYLEVALLMAEMGTFDFNITNVGQSATELVPCSENVFELVFDLAGNVAGIKLSGAVEYGKDSDGYYHVKNADGSLGDFIYLDVKYPTQVSPTLSLSQLVTQNLKIPGQNEYCDYKVFDLRYRIAYYTDENDENIVNYIAKFDLTQSGINRDFADYTKTMQDYIAKAETGENEGLVKVDDDLVKLLNLYIEARVNMLLDNEYEEALDNEWLRFCWYYKVHNAQNP
ncbi:MAG: redoxin domain-containing protein [Clostridiales bacterium]|nr:redoxin domain-containing protein [Clostridiales bacterium]